MKKIIESSPWVIVAVLLFVAWGMGYVFMEYWQRINPAPIWTETVSNGDALRWRMRDCATKDYGSPDYSENEDGTWTIECYEIRRQP